MKNFLKPIIPMFLVAACASTFTMPYVPVAYQGDISQKSSNSFTLEIQTTRGSGSSSTSTIPIGGGVMIPVESKNDDELVFGPSDQLQFGENFASELSRLGVLGELKFGDSRGDLTLSLAFKETMHFSARQKYVLRGALSVKSAQASKDCDFDVDSNEGQDFGTRMTTNAFRAQERASAMLMTDLVVCVQEFLSQSSPAGANNQTGR